MFVPSTLNCTFATATLSEAVAVKVTDDPPTVELADGTVRETDGGVVSGTETTAPALLPPPPSPPPPSASETIGCQGGTRGPEEVDDDCTFEFVLCDDPDAFVDELLAVFAAVEAAIVVARVKGPKNPVVGSW